MAYIVKNADGTESLRPSPNVKIFMKLEDPENTYQLFEESVEDAKLKNISEKQEIKKTSLRGFLNKIFGKMN